MKNNVAFFQHLIGKARNRGESLYFVMYIKKGKLRKKLSKH